MEEPVTENDAAPPRDDDRNDRRGGERLFACAPAHIELQTGATRTAILRDVSVSGALLLTRAKVHADDQLTLHLYFSGEPTDARVVGARVVRVKHRDPDTAGLWPYEVAVEFAEHLNDREAEIRALAAHQAELFGHV
jgi:hypothetical protein